MNENTDLLGVDGIDGPGGMRAKGGHGSRGAFLSLLPFMDPRIAAGLKDRTLQLSDKTVHVTNYPIGGLSTLKVFNDDNSTVIGKGNLSKGKLESGTYFVVTDIRILYGTTTGDVGVLDYSTLPAVMRNGEWGFKTQGAEVVTKASMELFLTTGNNNREVGTYKLSNPKLIVPQEPFELNIDLQTAAPANSFLKVILIGTSVTKA